MKLLKNDLQNNTEPNSPDRYQSSPNKGFVPFQRERDSMNRLISIKEPIKKQVSQADIAKVQENIISGQKNKPSLRKFNEYFKEQNIFLENQPKKHKVNRKTLIQILTENPVRKRPSTSQVNRNVISRPTSQPTAENLFYKTQSAQLFRPFSQNSTTIKRTSSTLISRRHSAVNSSKKSVSPQSSPKKVAYYQPQVNIEQNLDKYPQLNRVRRMQELEVKLHPDFEKKHDLFMDKMIKSKHLAFQLKVNLGKIDDIYF